MQAWRTLTSLAVGVGVLALTAGGVAAQDGGGLGSGQMQGVLQDDVTAEELIPALKPREGEPDIKYRGIPERTTRGLTMEPVTGGEADAETAEVADLPSVALNVPFEFDSAQLTPKAQRLLQEVAKAMRSNELQRYHFLLEGHTDSVGSAGYNQNLSERRARAVQRYLVEEMGVSRERLATRGHGERFLLDAQNPESGVNRRVEITNIGS